MRGVVLAWLLLATAFALRHGGLRGGAAADAVCDVPAAERLLPVALGTLKDLSAATLAQWEEAAAALAAAPVKVPTKKDENGVGVGPLPCRAVFLREALLSLFVRAYGGAKEAVLASWVGGGFKDAPGQKQAGARPEQLSGPFIAKKRLPASSNVAFFGDLHGNLEAFVAELRLLQTSNILGDDLVVAGNNLIVLCGDLVDRGPAPLEVLALALTLRLRNPDKVLLVQGNHEGFGMLEKYGTTHAADVKYGGTNVLRAKVRIAAKTDKKPNSGKSTETTILDQLYVVLQTFPVAAFVTVGAGEKWAMAMHGAFEPSVNVAGFLADAAPTAHAAIGAPGSGVSALRYDLWAAAYFSGNNANAQPKGNTAVPEQNRKLDTDSAPTWNRLAQAGGPNLGFQWGDFFSTFDKPATASSVLEYTPNRGYKFTQRLTMEWMAVSFSFLTHAALRAPRAAHPLARRRQPSTAPRVPRRAYRALFQYAGKQRCCDFQRTPAFRRVALLSQCQARPCYPL